MSPSAALVPAHQLRRGALFSGAAKSVTAGEGGKGGGGEKGVKPVHFTH